MAISSENDCKISVTKPSLLRHEAGGISTITAHNRWIASAHEDSSILVWHLDSRRIIHIVPSTSLDNEVVTAILWLTDARLLASAGKTIYEIDIAMVEHSVSVQNHASSTIQAFKKWTIAEEDINCMAIDRHERIWVGDDSGRLTIFQYQSDKSIEKHRHLKHEYICTSVCCVGGTKSSIISGGLDCFLKEWDDKGRLQNQLNIREERTISQQMLTSFNPPYIYCIISSKLRNVLYIGLGDAAILTVKLTGIGRRKQWHTEILEGHRHSVGTLAILGDDDGFLVSGSDDCNMKIWCLQDMTEIYSYNIGAKINTVAVTDQDEIIVGDVIGSIHIFQVTRKP